jgi:hypothetical protein
LFESIDDKKLDVQFDETDIGLKVKDDKEANSLSNVSFNYAEYEHNPTSVKFDESLQIALIPADVEGSILQFLPIKVLPVNPVDNLGKSPQKSILSVENAKDFNEAALKHLQNLEETRQYYIDELSKGDVMNMYMGAEGVMEMNVSVDREGTHLLIRKQKSIFRKMTKQILFSSITDVVLGPRTMSFGSYSWRDAKPWLCFSLLTNKGETIDFECQNSEQLKKWVIGIQEITYIGVSDKRLTRGKCNWHIALYKTMQMAMQQNTGVLNVWDVLVLQAYVVD